LTDARGLSKQVHRIELDTEAPANLLPSDIPALVTALAWPDFIGRRRSANSDEYLFTGGTAAELTRGSDLRGHEWIAAA
ncbi:hypothetical protein QP257_25535, partial [Escherichia coli]|nr:hypothetical protein [Escherichia coli]